MAPQFNLLKGRFEVVTDLYAYGSQIVQDGRTWIAIFVRKGPAHYEPRKVKGYELMVWN